MKTADNLQDKKRRLFALLLAENGITNGIQKDSIQSLPEIDADHEHLHEPFELNKLQKLYWQGQNGDRHAHMYFEFEIVARSPASRLESALNRLIERHPMLRAVALPQGQFQILAKVAPLTIPQCDLTAFSSGRISEKMRQIREEMIENIPSTDSWPLFDLMLCKVGARLWRMMINFSLLVDDGLSNVIFFNELFALYRDPEAGLKPVGISYRDYAVARSSLGASALYQRAEQYWRNRLRHMPSDARIPIKKAPNAVANPVYDRLSVALNPDIWRELQQQAKRKGLTASTVLLAAFTEVLGRITDDEHYIMYVMNANRLDLHPQINDVFGNFSSSILHIVDRTARKSFLNYARSVQQQFWTDLEYGLITALELSEKIAGKKNESAVCMPVSYSSNLFAAKIGQKDSEIEQNGFKHIFNALQRAHVLLDVQVNEIQGDLTLNCDFVKQSISTDFVKTVLNSYYDFLEELALNPSSWEMVCENAEPAMGLYSTGKSPLVPFRTQSQGARFFCVHPVGGGCFEFVPLAKAIRPHISFYGFQAPGLEGHREPLKSVAELADRYIPFILQEQKRGPYNIGGFSFGTLIAFEIASRLRQMGHAVGHVIIIEGIAPSPDRSYPMNDGRWLVMVAKTLQRSLRTGLNITFDDFHDLPLEAQRTCFEKKIENTGLFKAREQKDFIRGILDVSWANYNAARMYFPKVYNGEIELIRVRDILSADEILTFRSNYAKADMGWGAYSSQPVKVYEIPGDHYSILRSPDVGGLARVLLDILPI